MARRGRPRKRLSRMDAATDAMTAFGFDERLVQNSVKQLLKEYGGDDGWAFIEEYGYKELIDAILRDQETNDEQKGVSSQDERANDPALQSILGPSGSLVCSICNEAANTVGETSCSELVNAVAPMHVELCRNKQDISSPEVFCRPLVEGDGNTSKDVAEDEIPTQKEVSNAICRDGGNSRNQVQPGSYFDVFDRPPTSSRYPVNYLKLCSGSQVQSESNFHISTPPPTASLCPVNHLPVPVDHHPTALPSSKQGASSQDEIAENPALESTTGPSGTLVDSTCYKAGNTVGETTCSKLVDAVGEPTHEELCSYKQDIGSTGDSESAEARFDQAAKYWKQAIALTPEVLCLPPAEGDGHRCKDIREDQTSIQKGIGNVFFSDGGDSGSRALQASVNSVPTPADHLPTNLPSSKRVFLQPPRRRFPCYGWIGSDSEEDADDFIQLPQMILHRV